MAKVKNGYKGLDFDSKWEQELLQKIDDLGLPIQYQAPTITYKAQVFNDTKHKKVMKALMTANDLCLKLKKTDPLADYIINQLKAIEELIYDSRKYTFDFVCPPVSTSEEILKNPDKYRLVEAKGYIRKNQRGLNARDKMTYFARTYPQLQCYFMPQQPKAKYSPKLTYKDLGNLVGFTSITEQDLLTWK